MTWDRIRTSYDAVAEKYETRFLDELDSKPRDRELLADFAASVADPVVEIGCGPGQIGAFLAAHGRVVVGADLSETMTKLAARRLTGAVTSDMRALPVRTESVGGLLSFYSLIHLRRPDVGAALREFHRVLRPGGRVLIAVHEGDGEVQLQEFLDERAPVAVTFFVLDGLVDACHTAGLTVVLTVRRQPYASEGSTVRLYVEAQRAQ